MLRESGLRETRGDEWPRMRRCLQIACALGLIAAALSSGCSSSGHDQSPRSSMKSEASMGASTRESDVAAAKAVVRANIDALVQGDAVAWAKTLGKYHSGPLDSDTWQRESTAWAGVSITGMTTPGRHVPADSPPGSYTSNYGATPYRWVVLNVRFSHSTETPEAVPDAWDYIVVQEGPGEPWLVHDWGY